MTRALRRRHLDCLSNGRTQFRSWLYCSTDENLDLSKGEIDATGEIMNADELAIVGIAMLIVCLLLAAYIYSLRYIFQYEVGRKCCR